MYPSELEIKGTTESNTSTSFLDLLLSIGMDGQLHTSLYDKRDDFNFHITNFPLLSSNIPSSPALTRTYSSYECFILRAMRLSNKLLGQGYVKERLRSSLRKFYDRHGDLIKQYEVSLFRMLHDILDDGNLQWRPLLIRHYTNFWPYNWSARFPYVNIWLGHFRMASFLDRYFQRDVTAWIGWQISHHYRPRLTTRQKRCFYKSLALTLARIFVVN